MQWWYEFENIRTKSKIMFKNNYAELMIFLFVTEEILKNAILLE